MVCGEQPTHSRKVHGLWRLCCAAAVSFWQMCDCVTRVHTTRYIIVYYVQAAIYSPIRCPQVARSRERCVSTSDSERRRAAVVGLCGEVICSIPRAARLCTDAVDLAGWSPLHAVRIYTQHTLLELIRECEWFIARCVSVSVSGDHHKMQYIRRDRERPIARRTSD